MLYESAFHFLSAIREKYGADVKGVGPGSLQDTIELADRDEKTVRADLKELERLGFVGVDHVIAGCRIMEAGQHLLDVTLAD